MAKKKRKIWVFNPGGVKGVEISDEDLGKFAGIGLNGRKRKKKRSTTSSKVGGNKMARRKKRKKTTRRKKRVKRNFGTKKGARKAVRTKKRKKAVRKKAARKGVKTRKRNAAKRRRKTTRKSKVTRNRKRKPAKRRAPKRRKSRVRRNPGAVFSANPGAAFSANPRRRKRRKTSRRLPSMMSRRRPFVYNTPFLTRNPGALPNPRRKKRKVKKNYGRKFATPAGKYPLMNPGKPTQALGANLRALISVPVMIDAGQMTIGSVGSPILAASLSRMITKMTAGKTVIDINKPAGLVLQGVAGAVIATATTIVMKNAKMGKNILLGTIGGLFGDIAKKQIIPRLLGAGTAVVAPTGEPTPAVEPALEGLYGVRADVAAEVASLGAYATGVDILSAAADEQF